MIRASLTAAALALASPAWADAAIAWRPVSAETGRIGDLAALEQLARDFPDSGSVRLRLLNAQLDAGKVDDAMASLAWLKARGYVFGAGAQAQIPGMLGDKAEAAKALLIPQAQVIAASDVVGSIPADAGLIESVLAPGPPGVFIATSVTRRALFISAGADQWVRADIADADDLTGIVADAARNIGWIASANVDGSQDQHAGFSGLIGLTGDAEGWKLLAAPQGAAVSDIAIGSTGTLYASDPLGGGIYLAAPGAEALTVLVPPGTFRSPQGLAVSEDGQRLYLSDYRYGIAIVDLASRSVSRLGSDVPVILDGIDGLWRHGKELIAVQNGTSPMRISAFELSDDGMRVVSHRILEQANPAWTEPLGGSIAGDALIYVGNGQWDRYDKGKLKEDMESLPTQIRRLPLAR